MRSIRKTVAMAMAIALIALLVALGGCGGGDETESAKPPPLPLVPKELDITLDGYPSAQNVGILMAEKRGYFEDVGLDVWVRTPVSRLRPVSYVAEGEVALAVSHQPQVALAQEKGAQVATFGSLISEPTAAVIWLEKSKIESIADLKGKTIAITGLPFERDFLQSILARDGLTLDDVKVQFADYDLVPALVNGQADAIFGSWNIEGAQLEARRLRPVITPVTSLGIPAYEELVLIARPDRLSSEKRWIRAFVTAVSRGTEAAVEDPEAAARLIANKISEPNLAVIRAELEKTLPLLSESGE